MNMKYLRNFFGQIFLWSMFMDTLDSVSIGTFWQLSDIHLQSVINKNIIKCSNECDTSVNLLNSALSAAQKINSNPDFILWTGGNGPYFPYSSSSSPSPSNEKEIQSNLKNIYQKINETFPQTLVFPILGHSDVFPVESPSVEDFTQWCNNTLAKNIWSHFINQLSEEAKISFEKGCYYSVGGGEYHNSSKLRLILLNTMLWDNDNSIISQSDPADQFFWLNNTLNQAKTNSEKVLLIGHAAPGVFARNTTYRSLKMKYEKKLMEIIGEYQDIIIAMICANEHADTFRILYSNVIAFLAPSISPFNLSDFPQPRMRLYFYSNDNQPPPRLLDYKQYQLNFTQQKPNVSPTATTTTTTTLDDNNDVDKKDEFDWNLEYRAGELYFNHSQQVVYILNDQKSHTLAMNLSASSWFDLAKNFGKNNSLFTTYLRHYYGLTTTSQTFFLNKKDKDQAKCDHTCAIFMSTNCNCQDDVDDDNVDNDNLMVNSIHATAGDKGGGVVDNGGGGGASEPSSILTKPIGKNIDESSISLPLTLAVILGFCLTLIVISLIVNKACCRRRNVVQRQNLPPNANYDYLRM